MRLLTAFVFVVLLLDASSVIARSSSDWSETDPSVNLTHIFLGEINKKGKATGLHHLKGGQPTQNARLKKILSTANRFGIYTAMIQIRDLKNNTWKEKFSSMFPNTYSKQQVLDVILKAYRNADLRKGQKWGGPSGKGYRIEGYLLRDGRIITAYPIYRKTTP
ncbi:hypothetical protein GUA87_16010 [Sneathiella sp. P13V-1]|uniref:EndoU domain-containing protein n=1 Tax=Sneathiella sp. P13V-1 TaxID=2697366 RepID=UPI00187B4046|nr:EndoU domain-containing protein [Sneathiella sp. P13V-1]MBE7638363.1 hypothetical protein [Sneathiella sp. P13V-1]